MTEQSDGLSVLVSPKTDSSWSWSSWLDGVRRLVDTAGVRHLSERGRISLILLGGAIALGAAGWVLGPVWAVVGLVIGPVAAMIGVVLWRTYTCPDPFVVLERGQPYEALAIIQEQIPSWRQLARMWPVTRDTLADRLIVLSMALQACGRNEEAIPAAAEGVAIYRELAKARAERHASTLASALKQLAQLLAAGNRGEEAMAVMDEAIQVHNSTAESRNPPP